MNDDAEKMTEEQFAAAARFVDRAKRLVEWANDVPDMETFASPVLIGALVARQEVTGEGIDSEEMEKIGKWLERRYMDIMLIQGVARGHLGLKWDDDRNEPSFCLTARGREAADANDPESN